MSAPMGNITVLLIIKDFAAVKNATIPAKSAHQAIFA